MPATHRSLFPPIDENRALEELQRFHREIQRARRDREQASEEFDAFVRGFRESPAPSGEPHVQGRARARAGDMPVRHAQPPPAPAPAPVTQGTDAAPVAQPEARLPSSAPPIHGRSRPRRGLLWIAGAALAVAALAFVWRGQPAAPESSAAAPESSQPSPSARESVAPTESAAPKPAATAPAAASPVIELRTLRPVWLRLTVDGRRVLERELPAGETIPLDPSRLVIVRAGDAGAVEARVRGGAPRPLGQAGQVVTRTFEAPFRQ